MATLHVFTIAKAALFGLLLTVFLVTAPEKPTAGKTAGLLKYQATKMEGAWKLSSSPATSDAALAGATAVRIMADGFFTVAFYKLENPAFLGTYGGTYSLANGQVTEHIEFNTLDSTRVGTTTTSAYSLRNNRWQLQRTNGKLRTTETWEKLPESNSASPLAGAWRITGREVRDGQMNTIPAGARKTIKVLSGNRFQWIAYNSETAAFSGTGGGTYTWQNGKYTEHIEFFSRDSGRVGKQLTFDFELKDNRWHHSGLSSTGNRVNEIWQRLPNQ